MLFMLVWFWISGQVLNGLGQVLNGLGQVRTWFGASGLRLLEVRIMQV